LITDIKNDNGYVLGYVEWRQVGPSGFDVFKGEYIYLCNLWIHPDHRGKGLLQELIAKILMTAPEAKYAYFEREKYNNRMSKLYKRGSVERVVNV